MNSLPIAAWLLFLLITGAAASIATTPLMRLAASNTITRLQDPSKSEDKPETDPPEPVQEEKSDSPPPQESEKPLTKSPPQQKEPKAKPPQSSPAQKPTGEPQPQQKQSGQPPAEPEKTKPTQVDELMPTMPKRPPAEGEVGSQPAPAPADEGPSVESTQSEERIPAPIQAPEPQRSPVQQPPPAVKPDTEQSPTQPEISTEPPAQPEPKPIGPEPPPDESMTKQVREEISREINEFARIFSLPRLIVSVLILLLTFFAAKLLTILLERISQRRTDYAPWLRRIIPFVSFGLWFLTVSIVASIFVQSLLAVILLVIGVVIALGFASHQLLRDLVGGLVIMVERPFQLGDRIRIGNYYGEVKKIGLRSFQLYSTSGSVVVIPNADVMRQSIANANPGTREIQVTAEFLLPDGFDLGEAKRIAFEAAIVSPYVYANKPIEVQVDEIADGQALTKMIVKAYVFDAPYEHLLRSHIIELVKKGLQQRVTNSTSKTNR